MKIRRKLLTSLIVSFLTLSTMNAGAVEVIIKNGLDAGAVKSNIENSLSVLLTEINTAQEEGRNPNYAKLRLPEDVQTTVSMLWSNSPFMCIDEIVKQDCLTMADGRYQIRNIPLYLFSKKKGEEGAYKEGVATFDSRGNIYSFNLTVEKHIYNSIFANKNENEVTDRRRRELILDWTEQFRTAYNTHNLSFLDAVFSEDALIITGKKIERAPVDGVKLPPKVQLNIQNKKQYLSRLAAVFKQDAKFLINVQFDSISIVRHPNPDPRYDNIYGVELIQRYSSRSYSDEGYLYLVWDFENEDRPKIHVRAWSADKMFEIQDFEYSDDYKLSVNKE